MPRYLISDYADLVDISALLSTSEPKFFKVAKRLVI
jgi:hypothetical protein